MAFAADIASLLPEIRQASRQIGIGVAEYSLDFDETGEVCGLLRLRQQ